MPDRAAPRRQWWIATALAVGLFALYSLNGREIGAVDTIPGLYLEVSLLRGDGLRLDRFRHVWPDELPFFAVERHGQVVSRYPIGAPLLGAPFAAPLLVWLDHAHPGWEGDPALAFHWVRRLGKIAAAALAALTGAALYVLLCRLELGAVALPAALIAALGSNLWVTGSQSLWSHGPAALALTLTLALLTPPPRTRWPLLLAGGACAAIVYSRPQDVLFALLIVAWLVYRYRRGAIWFLPLPVVLGSLLLAYNLWLFGGILGGYGELIGLSSAATHGVLGYWADDVRGAALGTLLSPNRGLFVFSPWILLTLALVPALVPRLRHWPLICVVLCGLPIYFAMLVLQSTWWAGWSFGPRYWTDVVPLFALLLGFALDWARRRARAARAALLVAGALAILVQAIGAFCYPSSWNAAPRDIDLDHERLWSWRDTELSRCLREGPHRWE